VWTVESRGKTDLIRNKKVTIKNQEIREKPRREPKRFADEKNFNLSKSGGWFDRWACMGHKERRERRNRRLRGTNRFWKTFLLVARALTGPRTIFAKVTSVPKALGR